MDFTKVLEIGSRIATPLALAGFSVAAFTGTVWVFAFKNIPKVSQRGGLHVIILSVKLLFFLALIAMLLGVGSYVYLAKHERIGDLRVPAFRPFVNGVLLTPDCYVTIPVTNDSAALEFGIENVGNGIANGVQMTVNCPTNISVTAPTSTWMATAAYNRGSNEKVGPGYYSIFSGLIAPANRVVFKDPIVFQAAKLGRTVDLMFVQISSASCSTPFDVPFSIHFTNGIGAPHLGY